MNKELKRLGIMTIIITLFFIFSIPALYSAASDDGYEDGYTEGWLLGIKEAEYDMRKGNSKNYSRNIPSTKEIIEDYNLDTETSRYKNAFVDGFEDGFKNGYNTIYITRDDEEENDGEEEIEYAEILGFAIGETYGYRDYYDGKSNKWSRAVPSNLKIAEIFDLKKETNSSRSDFIIAFKNRFQEGYEEGYREAKFDPFEYSIEQGKEDGEYFGSLLGSMFGKKDYYLSKVSNWERNLPTRAKIISDFSLGSDSNEYEEAFLEAFLYSFETEYNYSYRSANSDMNRLSYDNGYNQGKLAGLKRGEGFASIDILSGQSSSLLRHTYNNEYIIINEFKLYLENTKYKEGFIAGYYDGLNEGYNKAYQDYTFTNSLSKLTTKIIPISGGEASTDDKRVTIKVISGTYYNDVAFSIDGLQDVNYLSLPSKNNFIKASDLYTIRVANSSYQFNNEKPIELSFEYYGQQNGGIYKYINNSWIYLPSKISEGRITTYIQPSSLEHTDSIYAVFVDLNYKNIEDIRGHWAKDEINAYARRGLAGLFNDNTYRPDVPITRGQLLGLLSRVYNWKLSSVDESMKELENLDDNKNLGDYSALVDYALKQGYMGLYPDNSFKVYKNVTYNQINTIMKKVTRDNNFNWSNVAHSMIMHKDTRSKSYSSMDNTLTRAEAIYMLYFLNE